MNRLNSFIFNSDMTDADLADLSLGDKKVYQHVMRSLLWFFIGILLIEIALHVLLVWQPVARHVPASVRTYFEYGTSTSAKLRLLSGESEDQAAAIAKAGWLSNKKEIIVDIPTSFAPRSVSATRAIGVSVYGMSFSDQIAEQLGAVSNRFKIRLVTGPATPPNWTFMAYFSDRQVPKKDGDYVVWTILTSTIVGMTALTSQTWNADLPFPFTYPKFEVRDRKLHAVWPSITSLPQLRKTLRDEARWHKWIKQLEDHDEHYSPLIYGYEWVDHSILARLIRRAFAKHVLEEKRQISRNRMVRPSSGESMSPLVLMGREFIGQARSDGQIPIILVIQDFNDDLPVAELLCRELSDISPPVFSTAAIVDPNDRTAYEHDGHIKQKHNHEIAVKLEKYMSVLSQGPGKCLY